jgi:hypothetical protein
VALSANGTAIAIWAEENPGGGIFDLKASRFVPQSGWSTPELLETGVAAVEDRGNRNMRVVMDAQGNAIAMWHQGTSLYYNRYLANGSWQGAVEFASGLRAGSNSFIRLVMNNVGRAVATWVFTPAFGVLDMRSMSYNPSTGWTAPAVFSLASEPYIDVNSSLFLTEAGRAYLVGGGFASLNPLQTGLFYRIQEPGGAWQAGTNLVTGLDRARGPYVDINAAGQGIAIWAQNDVAGQDTRNSLWQSLLR